MGDDLNDLEVMEEVGFVGCPNDAVSEVKKIADFVSTKTGGNGAVREFCDLIFKSEKRQKEKISCVIPCAVSGSDNTHLRKFSNSTLLDVKLDIVRKCKFDEIILSSNNQKLKMYENDNIKYQHREMKNDNHMSLYRKCTQHLKNNIIFHTTPLSPFLSVKSILKIIDYWITFSQYEMIIFCKKFDNIFDNDCFHNTIQQAGFICEKSVFFTHDNIKDIQNIKYLELEAIETIIIKDNLNFVVAENLYSKHFTSKKAIDNYMLNENFKKTKILDCTIRDSGYLNNWNWSYETVKKFVNYMGNIGIEYCEIGFLLNEEFAEDGCGVWRTINKDFSIISKLKEGTKTKISIMFDIGDFEKYNYDYQSIPVQSVTNIDLIRVCCFFQVLDRTKDVIFHLHEKGYKLTLNVMYASHLSDENINSIKNFIVDLPIDYLYFADSIGALNIHEISRFILSFKDIYPKKLGFHNHNNHGTVFSNILYLIDYNVEIMDTTVFGFGKNGGNTPFELVLLYLILKNNYEYDIYSFFDFYETIRNIDFYDNTKINLIKVKEILQQFLNIHPSFTKQYLDLDLKTFYDSILPLKNKSKWGS
jgi:4-hydroxy 2-oxovalerate aldolase